ncbi:hypothetical protein EX30DRAFT_32183 [Ascodesmis nigricans]|uniref:Secreted protein n=1 Tax=Ascodesmis nigricans TaxID=341454 RepID=A0A4S2MWM1_9PEZI|nr:hypothetical protein EX30DRAFT_32183 [Ascodesmis nigricans]
MGFHLAQRLLPFRAAAVLVLPLVVLPGSASSPFISSWFVRRHSSVHGLQRYRQREGVWMSGWGSSNPHTPVPQVPATEIAIVPPPTAVRLSGGAVQIRCLCLASCFGRRVAESADTWEIWLCVWLCCVANQGGWLEFGFRCNASGRGERGVRMRMRSGGR